MNNMNQDFKNWFSEKAPTKVEATEKPTFFVREFNVK